MTFAISSTILLSAGYVFLLRLVDMSLDTLRVLFVLRGRRLMAWFLGFFQALVFVMAISSVLSNVNNWLVVLSYAAGFATGNVLGMLIEERLAIGFTHLRIISPMWGVSVAAKLRESGFAVTEMSGRGKDGMVTLLSVNVLRKHTSKVVEIARSIDGEVFITSEDVRPLRRGYWRA